MLSTRAIDMNHAQREKYSRQILFAGLGEAGQERLLKASAVLVGCGALGTVVANLLVRSGLGYLRIIDRDFVEVSNLQRQTLFEESDANQSLPKAVAAERRLRAVNSDPRIEGIVADLTSQNASDLLEGFQLILDGTDNFETRLLVNDAAVSLNIPWVYAAAVAATASPLRSGPPKQHASHVCWKEKRDQGFSARRPPVTLQE
jgi:molybdopterin/thiamine biosynthesis adenylyltransferase